MHFVFFHIQRRIKLTKINVSQSNFFPSMPEVPSFTIYTHVICFQSFDIFRPVLTPPTKNRHELSRQPNNNIYNNIYILYIYIYIYIYKLYLIVHSNILTTSWSHSQRDQRRKRSIIKFPLFYVSDESLLSCVFPNALHKVHKTDDEYNGITEAHKLLKIIISWKLWRLTWKTGGEITI